MVRKPKRREEADKKRSYGAYSINLYCNRRRVYIQQEMYKRRGNDLNSKSSTKIYDKPHSSSKYRGPDSRNSRVCSIDILGKIA